MNRMTNRKRAVEFLLFEMYCGGPVLLDELRWKTLLIESKAKGLDDLQMTRSYRNSFSRTLRDHFAKIRLEKIPRADGLHCGVVTRAAKYRIASWKSLTAFETGIKPTVFVRAVRAGSATDKARVYCKLFSEYPERLVTVLGYSYRFVGLDCFDYSDYFDDPDSAMIPKTFKWDKTHLVETVIFPISIPLTVVATRAITATDLKQLAIVNWDIYRAPYPGADRSPSKLRQNQSIRSHWPGGYLNNPLSKGTWSKK